MMKKIIVLLAVSALVLAMAPAAQADVITGITATASSEHGVGTGDHRSADQLVDGSGLDGTGLLHAQGSSGDAMWLNYRYTGAAATWVLFDLGKVYAISSLQVWNWGESDWFLGAGVNGVVVEYGTTAELGSTVPDITSFDITSLSGADPFAGTPYTPAATFTARYIKFDITSTHGTGSGIDTGGNLDGGNWGYIGLSEVQFDGVPFYANGCEAAKDGTYTKLMALEKGDTNYDCKVNLADFATIALNWMTDQSF
jgi:hypothetical protein